MFDTPDDSFIQRNMFRKSVLFVLSFSMCISVVLSRGYRIRSVEIPVSEEKYRHYYVADQVAILEGWFKETHYPNRTLKGLIAKRIGVSTKQIQKWFQNRRFKEFWGKTNKERRKMEQDPTFNRNANRTCPACERVCKSRAGLSRHLFNEKCAEWIRHKWLLAAQKNG